MAKKPEAFDEQTVRKAEAREKEYDIRDRGGRESIPGLLLRVYPSGRKIYYAQVARGKRVKIGDAQLVTLKKARVDAKKVMGKAADGHDFQTERLQRKAADASTLGKFIDGDWSKHASEHIASFEKIKTCVKHSFAELLDTPMPDISEVDMARWKKRRNDHENQDGTKRKPVKLATMKRDATYLRAILNRAVKDKVITGHQLGKYKVAATITENIAEKDPRYLSADEEKRLREQLDKREAKMRAGRISGNVWRMKRRQELLPEIPAGHYVDHLKPLVLLALNTGLRRGDLFDLEWQHVDLERRQIRKVIGKTSHARRKASKPVKVDTLPLSIEAHQILAQLKRQRDPASELVFPSPVSGTRLDNARKAFDKVLTDAGIADFTFHDLRHSFASRLVQAGVDINTVRELMTHSDIKMTLVYAHLSPDHKAAALEKAFGGAS
jgi:integrase